MRTTRNAVARRCIVAQNGHSHAINGDQRMRSGFRKIHRWFQAGAPQEQLVGVRSAFRTIRNNWYGMPYMSPMRRNFDDLEIALYATTLDPVRIKTLWTAILAFRRERLQTPQQRQPSSERLPARVR